MAAGSIVQTISEDTTRNAGIAYLTGVDRCRHGNMPDCAHCSVRDIAFCSVFDESEMESVQALAGSIELEAGRALFEQGDPLPHVYNVVSGTLRLFRLLADGRRQITGFARPGDFLGLNVGEETPFSAEAVTEVRLCRFQRRELETLSDRHPKLCHRILDLKNRELSRAQEQLVLLGRKTPMEKVATFLLQELEASAEPIDSGGQAFDLHMTRSDIADYLGLTIETVSRTFTKLRQSQAIRLPRAERVEVDDLEILEDFSEH